MKLSITLLAIAAVCTASIDREWETYKVRFGKSYGPEEDAVRKANFIAADEDIKRHNGEGHSWTLQHNFFSDMVSDLPPDDLIDLTSTFDDRATLNSLNSSAMRH